MGIVSALELHLPYWFGRTLRAYVGLTGALVLLTAAATSFSGFGRLAYSLGEHGQLPRALGRLHRRTLVSPESILAACAISSAIILLTSLLNKPVAFLASLYSFGVLLAFTAAQLPVLKLRPAVRLAQERGAAVEALHVIKVPLDKPLDAELPDDDERAAASLAEAQLLGADHGVLVRGNAVRARSIGEAIVEEAERTNADLIVL